MMRRSLLLCCVVVLLAGCGGVDPDSPLGKRQAIFKQMLKTSEELGGMLRGRLKFDPARFQLQAQALERLSKQPWQHFPKVQDAGESAAKSDVWQRQERFQELARALQLRTAELLQASQAQPLAPAAVKPAQARVEAACKACHQEFRSH
ncbi:c-type cytochrome [Pseudomonas sp. N040]|uniref:c-type cytochrome n=1 Tax=Pseudomonas sp. N040 TaxID=2785325 RepID=UPI0018A31FDC|nr:cytochrome c [Pseudomonas sp. N040]MBF7728553.1 cytochrome c [Pseudomonas sp. N040]MBW7012193.1 cytochrome c [Pseudomonas sp. N040]